MKNLTQKYPKLHRFLWDVDYLGYRFWLFAIIGLSIIAPLLFYFERKVREAYKYSNITWGIVDKIHIGGPKSGSPYINFHFVNNKNELVFHEVGVFPEEFPFERKCLEDREIGDTVIIQYSIKDNSYAKIIECYWNDNLKKKYGFYKR